MGPAAPAHSSGPTWNPRQLATAKLAAIADLLERFSPGPLPSVAQLDDRLRELLAPHDLALEESAPQPRRRTGRAPSAIYELRCTLARRIPCRPQNLHDVFNALSWAAFPLAKWAVTTRIAALQQRALAAHGELPRARDREHDRLALLDEGGLLTLRYREGPLRVVVGHAIWQHAAQGVGDVRAAHLELPAPQGGPRPDHPAAVRAAVDLAWAAQIVQPDQIAAALDGRGGIDVRDDELWRPPSPGAAHAS